MKKKIIIATAFLLLACQISFTKKTEVKFGEKNFMIDVSALKVSYNHYDLKQFKTVLDSIGYKKCCKPEKISDCIISCCDGSTIETCDTKIIKSILLINELMDKKPLSDSLKVQ